VDNDSAYSYDDWKISLAYDLGKAGKTFQGMTVGVAYTDTTDDTCAYGRFSDTCTINGVPAAGAFPDKISGGNTTVWISKTF
jgi:hypothetical protein